MIPQSVEAEQTAVEHIVPKTRFYRPELDVLRFFAFLSVFLHHGPRHPQATSGHHFLLLFQESGGFGLSLFFFLSAYLITELLLMEKSRTGSIHMGAFYTRRILRIWPLYISFVLFGYLLGKVIVDPYYISIYTVLAYLLFAGNQVLYPPANPIGPLWSISVEEQFYVVWPWLVKFGGRRTLFITSSIVAVMAFSTMYYLSSHGYEPNSIIWGNSFVEFLFFATGTMMAVWWGARKPSIAVPLRCLMMGTGIISFLVAEHVGRLKAGGEYPAAWKVCFGYGMVDVGCCLVFLALLGCPKGFLPKPLIYLGKISYGLYVFHDLCFEISKHLLPTRFGWVYVTALLLTIAMAVPSYHFFETPFLRFRERFQFIKNRTT